MSMQSAHCRRLLIIAFALPAMGCVARPWRPPQPAPVASTTQPSHIKFTDYLQANRIGRWVYERTELRPVKRAAGSYTRRVTAERMQEGFLENRKMLPLDQYLKTSTPSGQRS